MIRRMRMLVIGGTAFMGREIARQLAERGDNVSVLQSGLPVTTFRPPFVHGPRQPFYREQFWDRLLDGHPIILPDEGATPLPWVFAPDVADACIRALDTPASAGDAVNIAHVERLTQRTHVEAYQSQPRRSVDYGFEDGLLRGHQR